MTFIFNGGGLYFTGHGCPLRIVAMCKHNLDLACVQGKNTLSDEIIPQTFKTYMVNRYEWIQYQRYQLNSIVNCYGLFRFVLINLQLLICSSSGPSCIAPDVDSPLTLAPRKHCRRCKSDEGKSKPSTVE